MKESRLESWVQLHNITTDIDCDFLNCNDFKYGKDFQSGPFWVFYSSYMGGKNVSRWFNSMEEFLSKASQWDCEDYLITWLCDEVYVTELTQREVDLEWEWRVRLEGVRLKAKRSAVYPTDL